MKFAIGYVLYNPEEEQIERINAVSESGLFSCVYVHDNSPVSHAEYFGKNIGYDTNLSNEGLSKAYNAFIRRAADKFDFLCIMDQDSDFPPEEMEKMQKFISSADSTQAALFAPRSYPDPTCPRAPREEKVTEGTYTINSGSFLNLSALVKNGLYYDENIFLDGVDYEFGIAARKKGLKILIYENAVLVQRLGTGRIMSGRGFSCHSAERYYTIAKARTYTLKKYKGRFVGGLIALLKAFGTSLKILRYETEKFRKIKNCFKGTFAGKYKKE